MSKIAIINYNKIEYSKNKIAGITIFERNIHSLISMEYQKIYIISDEDLKSISTLKTLITKNKRLNTIEISFQNNKDSLHDENNQNILYINNVLFFDHKRLQNYINYFNDKTLVLNYKSKQSIIYGNIEEIKNILKNNINQNHIENINIDCGFYLFDDNDINNKNTTLTKKNLSKADAYIFSYKPKPTDGFIDYLIYRRLSKLLTRYLFIYLPLTPNIITFISILISIVGIFIAAFLPGWTYTIIGMGLLAIAPIFDCIDGEIARLRFQFSKSGEWIDNVSDDIVNIILFVGISYKLSFDIGFINIPILEAYIFEIGLISAFFSFFHYGYIYIYLLFYTESKSGVSFNFKWWFEKNDEKSEENLTSKTKNNLFSYLKYLTRRDFFIFMYFIFSLFQLTVIPLVISLIFTIPIFILTIMQIFLYRKNKY